MKHYGDVTQINGANVEPVDVITFGSPCQDMSIAGKRAGIQDGTRSNLFFEAVRIIKEMRKATNGEYPKYAVWENVFGVFSSNKGRDFHAVLEALCSVCDDAVSIPEPVGKGDKLEWRAAGEIVGNGYSVAWRTLDAQYWGVPQRRKRIYLVADFTGQRAGKVLFKPDGLHRDMPQSNEAGEGIAADAVGGADGSNGGGGQIAATLYAAYGTKWNGNAGAYNGENFVLERGGTDRSAGDRCLNPWDCQSKRIYSPDGVYPTLPAMDCGGANNQAVIYSFDSLSSNSMKSKNPVSGCREVDIAKCIDTSYPDPSKNQGGIAIVEVAGFIGKASTGAGSVGFEIGCAATLRAGQETHCVIALQGNGIDRSDNAGGQQHMPDKDNFNAVIISAKPPRKYIIRRLTPTECARLQGFPYTWGELAPYDPADADFWESVRKTHARINGKAYKPTKNLKKWYDKLHTDSAEYKAYGNGLALPCAEFVIHNIAEQGVKTLGSLFDGIGGFPLAGAMNGIIPLWASEVEPYPIAVTLSRFGGNAAERESKS